MRYSCRDCGPGVYLEKIDNRLRCPKCTRVVPLDKRGVPMTVRKSRVKSRPSPRPLRSKDAVRFRTGGGGFGIGGAQRREQSRDLDTWQTPVRRAGARSPRQTVGRFPRKPEYDVFHTSKSYQVIIYDLPLKELEDVRCEVINGALVVESLLDGFDFLQKFSLPDDVLRDSLETSLKNAVLNIRLEKAGNKKGEQ